jgi:hypothetical protein
LASPDGFVSVDGESASLGATGRNLLRPGLPYVSTVPLRVPRLSECPAGANADVQLHVNAITSTSGCVSLRICSVAASHSLATFRRA